MTKPILIILISLFISTAANAVVTMCRRKDPLRTSPASCSTYTGNGGVDSNRVYSCSGGESMITEFEVWGGCGTNAGTGGYTNPIVQIPIGVQKATLAAGPNCYCQIKSLNTNLVAPSARWVFNYDYGSASACADVCANACAGNASTIRASVPLCSPRLIELRM